jgi:excisionase family DNA binding protein
MEKEEIPQPKSIDDLMGAIRLVVRQEITKALHPAVQDRLLTVAEAADYLRLAKPTLYRLVQQNKIPYMKKTKRLYFSESKLKEWLDQSIIRSNYERENSVINKLFKYKAKTGSKF